MTILQDVKNSLGILPDNLGFDQELLIGANSARAFLAHNGVVPMSGMTIGSTTEWPDFSDPELEALVKQYIVIATRQFFDPIPSETIARIMSGQLVVLEGRISHEVEEMNNV